MKGMKEMPLMDAVQAWTFAGRFGDIRIDPATSQIARTLRMKLRSAERFILNDDATRLLTRLCHERDRMESWSYLARLPFDVMWVEFNNHVHLRELLAMGLASAKDPSAPIENSTHIGFLMFKDSTDPNCARWIAHSFSNDQEIGVYPEYFALVFDPEGDGKFPVRGSQFWNKPTISLRPNFPTVKIPMLAKDLKSTDGSPIDPKYLHNAFLEADVETLLAGISSASKDEPLPINVNGSTPLKGPEWLMPRLAAIAEPWWDALFAHDPKVLNDCIIKMTSPASSGPPRFLIAMLATLNSLPRDLRIHPARTGKHSIGMYTMPYFGASIVEIAIPRDNRLVHARKTLDKAGKHARHLRRHKVIGHWRVVERGKQRNYLCRHIPAIIEHNHAICERCQMLVCWINSHERGDATLGVVSHDYEVIT